MKQVWKPAAVLAAALLSFAAAGPAPAKEPRAVWIHAGLFGTGKQAAREKMDILFTRYAALGITHVYCFGAKEAGERQGWDFLSALLEAAHARGIGVHPVLCPGRRVRLEGAVWEHPEWLIRGRKGEIHPHLNLANPEVKEYILRQVDALLAYPVDGLHLDYIRFPAGQCFSYDAATRAAFKEKYGADPLEGVQDCGSMVWSEWILWNAGQVTDLVRKVKARIAASGKGIPLSAAVFPDCDTARVMIGQDWVSWAKAGIIDVLCPMLYTNDADLFEKLARKARAAAGDRCRVLTGIAVKSSHNTNTPGGVVEEVGRARAAGADGVVFFSGYSLDEAVSAALQAAVFKGR